ncbi:hypothetical protein QVD17_31601 [Tagetes erecta]|uniref:Uncharacterized protein n=1 Tax=Tagetes erecta TaxID=13708 RepID=A0AAD8K4K7_TARER|nr:hypothetical protein QVD17_31601 [Tagetes erecta]
MAMWISRKKERKKERSKATAAFLLPSLLPQPFSLSFLHQHFTCNTCTSSTSLHVITHYYLFLLHFQFLTSPNNYPSFDPLNSQPDPTVFLRH